MTRSTQKECLTWYRLSTVTDPEIKKMMSLTKMKNFFIGMDTLASVPGFRKSWLITSIDNQYSDGKPRYPIEKGNHLNSHAVDIVPMDDDLQLSLPIPLNRSQLVQRLFRVCFDELDSKGYPLPIIVFESDHLHIDINHDYNVTFLNNTRPYFDKLVSSLSKVHPMLNKALDDATLREVS